MSIDKLRADAEKAEQKAHKLQAQKEEIREKLREAVQDAAEKQKLYCDAVAAQAIAERDDLGEESKRALAQHLGLELPQA